MQHRDSMRTRPVDDSKSLEVIKNIEQAKLTSTPEKVKELNGIEADLYKAIGHFDRRKKIVIPKSLSIDNINNEKNEKPANSHKKKSLNSMNTTLVTDMPNYELSEYKRPEHYITYSSKEKDINSQQIKDYEYKLADEYFVNFHNNFIGLGDLEKIISTLENNIGKGEKIPDEMAKKIIEEKFGQYKTKSDVIIKFFNERRNELKKSLLRKYWRLQKSTDKYFSTTFRRRGSEKMKIRKSNQNKEDSYDKVKEASELCKNELLPILNSMIHKENLNKFQTKIEQLIFQVQCKLYQKNDNTTNELIILHKNLSNQLELLISPLRDNEVKIEPPPHINPQGPHRYNHSGGELGGGPHKNKNEPPEGQQNDLTTSFDSKSHRIKKKDIIKRNDIQEEEKKNNKNKPENYLKPIELDVLKDNKENKNIPDNPLRVRIRLNRCGKKVFDRYFQNDNSMDPFDDNFNENINYVQNLGDNLTINPFVNDSFEDWFNKFYEKQFSYLSVLTEDDEDNNNSQQTLKKNNSKVLLNRKRNIN